MHWQIGKLTKELLQLQVKRISAPSDEIDTIDDLIQAIQSQISSEQHDNKATRAFIDSISDTHINAIALLMPSSVNDSPDINMLTHHQRSPSPPSILILGFMRQSITNQIKQESVT